MYHPPTFPGDFEIPTELCATVSPAFVSCDFLSQCGTPVGHQWGASWIISKMFNVIREQVPNNNNHPPPFPDHYELPAVLYTILSSVFMSCDFTTGVPLASQLVSHWCPTVIQEITTYKNIQYGCVESRWNFLITRECWRMVHT